MEEKKKIRNDKVFQYKFHNSGFVFLVIFYIVILKPLQLSTPLSHFTRVVCVLMGALAFLPRARGINF